MDGWLLTVVGSIAIGSMVRSVVGDAGEVGVVQYAAVIAIVKAVFQLYGLAVGGRDLASHQILISAVGREGLDEYTIIHIYIVASWQRLDYVFEVAFGVCAAAEP